MAVFLQIKFTIQVVKHYSQYPLMAQLLVNTFFLFNSFTNWLFLFGIFYSTMTAMICATVYLKLIAIKFSQTVTLLNYNSENGQIDFHVTQFKRHYTHTLIAFLDGNDMFSQIFFAYIIIFVPSSAAMINWVIHEVIKDENRFFISFIVCHELMFLFGVHLALANFSSIIHKSSGQLFHLIAGKKRIAYLRNRLKLSQLISTISSANKMGFTYGAGKFRFGIVKMATFGKVSFERKTAFSNFLYNQPVFSTLLFKVFINFSQVNKK